MGGRLRTGMNCFFLESLEGRGDAEPVMKMAVPSSSYRRRTSPCP